ncbi:MAG: hypothetical protein KDB03_09875 [Planctomycetales bacterium]|nr:hypothetical protein [Planctomycetales bacterium]
MKRNRIRRLLAPEQLEDRRVLSVVSWHNFLQREDVNGDTFVTPIDALIIINELNGPKYGAADTGLLPIPGPEISNTYGLDVSCDGFVAPNDALRIINALNADRYTSGIRFTNSGGIIRPITDSSGTCNPRLVESHSFESQIAADIIVPNAPSALDIEFRNLVFDTSDDFINDAFEAALVDEQGTSLVHTVAGSRDAFFNFSEGQVASVGVNAQYSGNHLKVDLHNIAPGTKAKLILRLVNNDSDSATSVQISNFKVINEALGTPAGIHPAGSGRVQIEAPIDFGLLSDVTPSMSTEYGRTSFDPLDGILQTDFAVRNSGNYSVKGPLVAVIDHLSDPTIGLSNADGFTPSGLPYFNLDWNDAQGVFGSHDVTAVQQLLFKDPNAVQFTYDVAVFGQLNRPPEIVSQAITEAVVGHTYAYTLDATDPDGDSLSYSLLSGPNIFDGHSLLWIPSASDVGSHSVSVRVEDGRGGIAEQRFNLTVIDPPPNRPPVFTSTPVVDANLGSEYIYQATARDEDDDPVTFSMLDGPPGMQVDSQTGSITWTPEATTRTWDAARDFSPHVNAVSDWSYGWTATLGATLNVYPNQSQVQGLDVWDDPAIISAGAPSVAHNGTDQVIHSNLNIIWQPGQLSFHPGQLGQQSVVRWTAPITGSVQIAATFGNIDFSAGATTDVYVLHNGQTLFSGTVNGVGSESRLPTVSRSVTAGDTIDFVVGVGTGGFVYDSTSIAATISSTGLNAVPVTIGVVDNQGGEATQRFYVSVQPVAGNHAPVIVSTPDTAISFTSALPLAPGFTARVLTTLTPSESISGMAVSTDGKLYFSNLSGPIYQEDLATGEVSVLMNSGLVTPVRMVVPNGSPFGSDLLHADLNAGPTNQGTVFRTDRITGVSTAILVGATQRSVGDAFGVALGRGSFGNDLYVMDLQGISSEVPLLERITPSGQVSIFAEGGPWTTESLPGHIEFSPSGPYGNYLFVADQASHTIWRVDDRGRISEFLTSETISPVSLRFSPGGRFGTYLYALESSGRIVRIDADGLVLPFSQAIRGVDPSTSFFPDMAFDPLQEKLYVGLNNQIYEVSASDIAGFTYDVQAVDADGDTLTYRLIDGPAGMQFESGSTKLAWMPTPAEAGLQHVILAVEDGRGGVSQQDFTIVVDINAGSIRGAVLNDPTGDGRNLQIVDATVRGDANPWLAGMPDGSVDPGGDVAPDRSPAEVNGLVLTPGESITVLAYGGFDFGGSPPKDGPDGDLTAAFIAHYNGAINGVSNVVMPANALAGVFLGPDAPNLSPAPNLLSFTTGGNVPNGINYLSLAPALKQVFFIGDGHTQDGTTQQIIIPEGATRLFLGSMDGFGWYNNSGSITARVTFTTHTLVGLPGQTVYLDQNDNGQLDVGEASILTNERGEYRFAGLATGNYVVRQELAQGWRQTSPPDNGSRQVPLATSQSASGIDFGNASELSLNRNPVITAPPPTSVTAGDLLRHSLEARDLDADPLEYDLVVHPDGMTIHPTLGVLAWRPGVADVGVNDVIVRVRDGRGGLALEAFRITVYAANSAPTITSRPSGPVSFGVLYRYAVRAQDADGDTLTFGLEGAIGNMQIDNGTGVFTWLPTQEEFGWHRLTVLATDPVGNQARQTIDLQVTFLPNRAPVINSKPREQVRLGNKYLYAIEATDPDGEPLSYWLDLAPAGMTIDAQGLVSWTPNGAQLGENAVNLRVTDGRGAEKSQSFTVSVRSQTSNRAPVITSTAPPAATVGREYRYSLAATDADDDTLAYSLEKGPLGMSLDALSGTLRWTPTAEQLGTQQVTLRVSDTAGGSTTQTFDVSVRGSNLPPEISSSPITAAAVGRAYTYRLQASDPEGRPLTYALANKSGNMSIDASGVVQWTPVDSEIGNVTVRIRISDDLGAIVEQSYMVVVSAAAPNQPPAITSQPLLVATVGQTYQYQLTASDSDGDPIRFALLEFPDGMSIDDTSGLIHFTSDQEGVGRVTALAEDQYGGEARQSFEVVVSSSNLPPEIISSPNTKLPSGVTYRYDLQARDPNVDPLTYALVTGPIGMSMDSEGRITWKTESTDIGSRHVKLMVSDDRGLSALQEFDLDFVPDTEAPQIRIQVSSNPIALDDTLVIRVQATDNVALSSLDVSVGGIPVALDIQGRASVLMSQAGSVQVAAIAKDPAGNTKRQTTDVLVIDANISEAPNVDLASPAEDATITSPSDVIGTVQDVNLVSWSLEVAAFDSGNFKQIARGTNQVSNGKLATFDPTLLQNDSYILRLTALNAGGLSSSIETIVNVSGNLKLGNFTLSYTDLSIPVAGIPITITRTYDTLSADQDGELGYGWKLAFRDVDLRTNLPNTGDEFGGLYTPFRDGTRVYVTLPGGQREGYTFRPKAVGLFDPYQRERDVPPGFQSGNGLNSVYFVPYFVPDKGVTTSLTVRRLQLSKQGNEYFQFGGGLPYNPADPSIGRGAYELTTKEGIKFRIDGTTSALVSISDRNGNAIHFAENEISSPNGETIKFERDARNRIIAVIDPNGQSFQYKYDQAGDLIRVIDREGNATQFHYSAALPHYVDSVTDPLGRIGTRVEYDEQGRISRTLDPLGNASTVVHDLAHSAEIVSDALGNSTTFQYDEQGNVTVQVDAMGGVTTRTFDENNNVISERDPLGNLRSASFDDRGNLLTGTDALGNVTFYTYNAFGQLVSLSDAQGNTASNSYDASGNNISSTDALGNKTARTFDSVGNTLSIMDALGNTTQLVYTAAGKIARTSDAYGHVSTSEYDSRGNRLKSATTVTVADGVKPVVVSISYTASGLPALRTDPNGATIERVYDAADNLLATIDSIGRRIDYVYDDRGQLIKTEYPDGTSTSSRFDVLGREISTTDRLGRTTNYTFDALGRQTSATDSDGATTRTEYDAVGHVIAITDPLGNTTRYEYDAVGHQVAVINALNERTSVTFDTIGRPISTTDPLGHTTRHIYDVLGREIETIFADGSTLAFQYDANGQLVALIDQNGSATHYVFDKLGNLIETIDALGQRSFTLYDELGRMTSQTDANGHTIGQEYDDKGRLVATILPMGESSKTTYDGLGRVLTATDANGQTVSFVYDNNDRLIARRYSDGSTEQFTYNSQGQKASTTNANGTTLFQYDSAGRLTLETQPDGQFIRYTYDLGGNVTSITDSFGTVNYSYDKLNRLQSVTDRFGQVTSYKYDAAGNRIETILPNGVTQRYEYDALNRLVAWQATNAGGVIIQSTYSLDPAGNVLSERTVSSAGTTEHTFAYDRLQRVSFESIVGQTSTPHTISYQYDAVGNIVSLVDSEHGETFRSYDANDQIGSEISGGVFTTYLYDQNGNLISKFISETNEVTEVTYHWDVLNRLLGSDITSLSGVSHVEYTYDNDGNRTSQTVDGTETRFLNDSSSGLSNVLLEYTPAGEVSAAYTRGQGLISMWRSAESSFYLSDRLGSTRVILDEAGTITDRYDYSAYGSPIMHIGTTSNPFRFAGQQLDSSLNAYYLRARYYSVESNRFLSRDTNVGRQELPLSWNRYLYSQGNPTNLIDPSGHEPGGLAQTSITTAAFGLLTQVATSVSISALTHHALGSEYTKSTFLLDIALGAIGWGVVGGLYKSVHFATPAARAASAEELQALATQVKTVAASDKFRSGVLSKFGEISENQWAEFINKLDDLTYNFQALGAYYHGDAFQIGFVFTGREAAIRHELGHVLDSVINPTLFTSIQGIPAWRALPTIVDTELAAFSAQGVPGFARSSYAYLTAVVNVVGQWKLIFGVGAGVNRLITQQYYETGFAQNLQSR